MLVTRHIPLFGSIEHTRLWDTPKGKLPSSNNNEFAKKLLGKYASAKRQQMCDINGELISNGMLPHK